MTVDYYCSKCLAIFRGCGGGDIIFCDKKSAFAHHEPKCPLETEWEHEKRLNDAWWEAVLDAD